MRCALASIVLVVLAAPVAPVAASGFRLDSAGFAYQPHVLAPSPQRGDPDGADAGWRFDDPWSWGRPPWGAVRPVGLGVKLGWNAPDGWRYLVVPSLTRAAKDGRDEATVPGYGLHLAASRTVRPGLTLGVGLDATEVLQQSQLLPYPLVDWRLDARWRLANPLGTGPAGPAGLELSYRGSSGRWDIGAGGAYRSFRFRLPHDDASAPHGIGQETGIPLYLRFGYAPSAHTQFDVYLGATLAGRLSLENTHGELLTQEHLETGPLFAIQFGGQF
ncbi:hypothetical protein N8I74_13630 [Chitiniphilus purpureus]|uniref:MipA/OmpV family protein n=1 Tax=Chitiniphilus purpureus TaxID=2981137 RepID=A0ABY6DJ49_9NEIS|nr:hypothetical protein [Chitiniphilus sp. CD1]UXY14352.1 hypothetical protein N8I74_13630 [Chitiniphilus sp. CD1]